MSATITTVSQLLDTSPLSKKTRFGFNFQTFFVLLITFCIHHLLDG